MNDRPSAQDDLRQAELTRIRNSQRTLFIVAYCGMAAGLLVGVVAKDVSTIYMSLFGAVAYVPGLVLWRRGEMRTSEFAIAAATLAFISFGVAFGTGFHDIAMMGYPLVLILAAVSLTRAQLMRFAALEIVLMLACGFTGTFDLITDAPATPLYGEVFTAVIILVACGVTVSIVVGNMRDSLLHANHEIELRRRAEMELERLSVTDSMTAAYNRRYFDDAVDRLDAGAVDVSSIIVADIDDLKHANDNFGHAVGDQLVIDAAELLAGCIRESDLLARVGGDEFAVLLPNTGYEQATLVLERIDAELLKVGTTPSGPVLRMSAGVATGQHGHLRDAFKRADSAMYAAKTQSKVTA